MVARREKVGVTVPVRMEVDERSAAEVRKKLVRMKADWKEVAKASKLSVKEIKNITTAAEAFSDKLSKGAQASFKEFAKLGDELDDARQKAAALKDQMSKARGASAKKALGSEFEAVKKQIAGLNKQISEQKKGSKGYKRELDVVLKAQRKYRASLEKAADYTGKNMLADITSGLKRGGKGGAGQALGGVGKWIQGKAAKRAIASGAGAAPGAAGGAAGGAGGAAMMGGLSRAVMGLSKSVPYLAAAAAAIGVLWKVLAAASEHQTKLNKALLEGTGTANDFVKNTQDYRDVLDELRHAAVDNAGSMLKFGADSEAALKIVNQFARESTGSLIKTRDTLASIGGGDVRRGMLEFSRNAIAYGKALGMEGTEVAGMMGKFVSETGYSAGLVQDAMGNIVRSAATANMPMTKFMDIFRRVLPDVELYQNRLEELTGTIKLLSKAMSPKDVQKFMDAFAKGFKGVDFKQRLKTVLITGTGFVSKALSKDFESKAQVMAQNFAKFARPGEDITKEFQKAYKGGEKSMGDFVAKMQGRAAREGEKISGTVIGDAMKLASYEATRRKGGALNMATAMRGGGMLATYKILKQLSQSFTKGFDGLSEHVIRQLGITEDQYEALRTTNQTMTAYRSELEMYGKTSSVSMNKSLREAIAQRKGIKESQVTTEDMMKATEEDLFTAAEMSNTMKDTAQTAEDLAVEQTTATTSISEKISNVIAFLLEKIFTAIMDFVGKPLDALWKWFSGGKDTQELQRSVDNYNESIQKGGYGEGIKSQFDYMSQTIKEGLSGGKTGEDLAVYLAQQPAFKNLAKMDYKKVFAKAEERGMSAADAAGVQEAFYQAQKKGDMVGMGKALAQLPGNMSSLFQELGQGLAVDFGETQEASDRRRFKTDTRRAKTREVLVQKTAKGRRAAAEAADIETNLVPLAKKTAAAVAASTPGAAATMKMPAAHIKGKAPAKAGPAGAPPAATTEAGGYGFEGVTTEDQEDATTAITSAQEDSAKTVEKQVANVYDGVTDVFGLLKRGIILQSGFLVGPYKTVVKDATYASFDQALGAFAPVIAKMWDDEDFRKTLGQSNIGWEVAGHYKAGASELAGIDPSKAGKYWDMISELKRVTGRQGGGHVPDTGMYRLHRGEAVLDAMTYESVKQGLRGGGAGGNVTVNMTVNAAPNWSRQEFENAVVNVMGKVARRP